MDKIRVSHHPQDCDVVAHAIFWRPLRYFSLLIREGEDEFDQFNAVSFLIGNAIHFDLRTYAGHPEVTVSLYLPASISDQEEILRTIKIVIKQMLIPKNAVAWRRGDEFTYGELKRPKGDRLREPEARLLALKIAAQQPNRTASTGLIKRETPNYIELSDIDRRQSATRNGEALWQQIVGNVISHQDAPAGPFRKGYAIRTANGLSVTEKGMDYLKSVGFLGSGPCLVE